MERIVLEKVAPPSVVRAKGRPSDAPPFVLTKLMLPLESTAMRASGNPSAVGVTLFGAENVSPPSVERMNCTLGSPPALLKRYRILIFPAKSTTICSGAEPKPPVREGVRFFGVENVAPPSVLRLRKALVLPGVESAQVTLMLPAESTAISGRIELPELLEMFCGAEKVAPPSVERLKKISALLEVLPAQTTSMFPLESTAI